jgi:hypothetical protein
MKKIITLIILIQISLSLQAQKVPYEKLEELSTSISNLQNKANGLTYNEGSINYELSFPEENFQVSFSNQLATVSVYKKSGDREVMELTENIDLSEVISVKILSANNKISQISLIFPINSIKTQIFEEGVLLENKEMTTLVLYTNQEPLKLYAEIIKLCNYLKKETGTFTYDVEELATIWETALNQNTISTLQSFYYKYISTLYDDQVNVKIKLLEAAELKEKNRLIAIKVENDRIKSIEEANRIKAENERLARLAEEERERLAQIAEEARLKDLRNVGFAAFRVGYVSPTSGESKKLIATPAYITNNIFQAHSGTEFAPYSAPLTKGQVGLETGFSAGFNGIVNLEFINKSMPSRIGFGLPLDINFAMMKYSWEDLGTNAGKNAFFYKDAKYGFFGVVSAGVGLSLSIRPAKGFFIDFIGRPDFYLTTGGKYEVEGKYGTKNYKIETTRNDNSAGISKTFGVNIRYKRVILGFEMKQGIEDKEQFSESVSLEENGFTSNYEYSVKPSNLNLDFMQMTLGIVF